VELLQEAIRLEELGDSPRPGFIADLQREVAALQAGD
jgi:hypothetical protein